MNHAWGPGKKRGNWQNELPTIDKSIDEEYNFKQKQLYIYI